MSAIVILIAAAPAVAVVAVALYTKSKLATFIAAVIAATLGVVTGSPAYIALDLLFVAVATYLAWPSSAVVKSK